MSETNSAKGQCLCGSVRYEFELPSKFVAHCHCSLCRRASGAPFVTWIGTWEAKLHISDLERNLAMYHSTAEGLRQFCKKCGTQLFFRSPRWPDEVHVTRATVTSNVDRLPQAHVFYSDKADWMEIHDKLPKCGGTTGVEPLADKQ
ncbi:MAG: GFA family protein [Bdellovibrionales bacterium]|nr:GFA family protein [Bdellovibrionales bacterium]